MHMNVPLAYAGKADKGGVQAGENSLTQRCSQLETALLQGLQQVCPALPCTTRPCPALHCPAAPSATFPSRALPSLPCLINDLPCPAPAMP